MTKLNLWNDYLVLVIEINIRYQHLHLRMLWLPCFSYSDSSSLVLLHLQVKAISVKSSSAMKLLSEISSFWGHFSKFIPNINIRFFLWASDLQSAAAQSAVELQNEITQVCFCGEMRHESCCFWLCLDDASVCSSFIRFPPDSLLFLLVTDLGLI